MLPLPEFSLEQPDTLARALELLAQPGSRPIAGGTDLLPSMKQGLHSPATLVSLARLPQLRQIRSDERGLRLGAGCTLAQLARHPRVRH